MITAYSVCTVEAMAVQSYAALSIGLICLIIGVPIWWKTTEVYRVPLPYSEISALADLTVTLFIYLILLQFPEILFRFYH